jgi:hypothetical protein
MSFDNEFNDEFDEQEFDEDLEDLDDLDDEFGENIEEIIEEPFEKIPDEEMEIKTPASKVPSKGKKISVYFMSTIGPGEKKQKVTIHV